MTAKLNVLVAYPYCTPDLMDKMKNKDLQLKYFMVSNNWDFVLAYYVSEK